jgi:hypothetical protein
MICIPLDLLWNFECPEMPIVQALIICCIIYCKHNPVAQPLTGTMQRGSQRDRHKRNILDDLVFASMIMGMQLSEIFR